MYIANAGVLYHYTDLQLLVSDLALRHRHVCVPNEDANGAERKGVQHEPVLPRHLVQAVQPVLSELADGTFVVVSPDELGGEGHVDDYGGCGSQFVR